MKKIVFFLGLVVCGIDFSETCKWISDKPTYYEKKMIELIESKKMGNKIYCDLENDKMIYQMLNKDGYSENLEIGLIYNEKEKKDMTYEVLFEYIDKFEEDVKKILPLNLSDRDYDYSLIDELDLNSIVGGGVKVNTSKCLDNYIVGMKFGNKSLGQNVIKNDVKRNPVCNFSYSTFGRFGRKIETTA